MKDERSASDTSTLGAQDPTALSPGKRTRTAALPAVQQRAAVPAPPTSATEAAASEATGHDDPFALHLLDAPVQRRGDGGGATDVHAAAAHGLSAPATSLPFLDQIQRSFGADHDVSGVQAHVGGAAAEASAAMGAEAYATGDHVAFARSPDLHTAAHEAAHVVQQAQGVNLYGGVGQAGDAYERAADAVADRVVAGEPAADLLGARTGGAAAAGHVQRKAAGEPGWSVRARDYHRRNPGYVAQFTQATGGACLGADGELDPAQVARWQRAHGVKPDGHCGPLTVCAAIGGDVVAPAQEAPPQAETAEPEAGPTPGANVGPTPGANVGPTPGANVGPGGANVPMLGPVLGPDVKPADEAKAQEPAQPLVKGEPLRFVLDGGAEKIGFQKCLVFVSPGGLSSATPDIFLFFHGYQADYGIDDQQKKPKGMALYESGRDATAEAMAHATGKNLVAILPQGNIGRGDEAGGRMKGLKAGLPTFLSSVLGGLAPQLGVEALAPGRISISGHSAGGYEGVHSAMKGAGELADNITDMTLMDSSYSTSHFADARDWIFSGSPGKNLRIIGQKVQIRGERHKFHGAYFDPGPLGKYAAKQGFEVKHLPDGEKRENGTVIQHSQLLKDGQVHADILILESKRSHGQIRDDVMDDAILSIGEGSAGAATFGRDALAESEADQDPDAPGHQPTGKGAEVVEQKSQQPANTGSGDLDDDVPQPEHNPDVNAPEKPKVPASTPAKPAGKEVYKAGGRLAKEKLSRQDFTDAEYKFKQRVYEKATARLGDKVYGGVDKENLSSIGGKSSGTIRADVHGPLTSMMSAMEAAIASGTPVDGKEVGSATGIRVSNGYRSPETDFGLWDKYFPKYFRNTAEAREATGNPLGEEAAGVMVKYIANRKAPPGGSNHSNGTAVDLQMEKNGKNLGNDYDNQAEWKKSWHLAWLKANAPSYGFKPYEKEHWHWTYVG